MRYIRRFFSILFLFWGLIIFLAGLLIVMPLTLLAGLIFRPYTALCVIHTIIRCWALSLISFAFFPVFRYGISKLQKGQAYIYVCNHNSYLDSPAVFYSIPQAFKPLGKIEMMKIPIFSIVYKKVCVLIDRSSKESREASVEQLKKELGRGISILIFPEGTMNKTDVPVADFYDGAFRIAIETQTPLAPAVLINARHLLPRANPLAIRPGIIKYYQLDPIETKGLTADDMPELKAKVHALMTEAILKYS